MRIKASISFHIAQDLHKKRPKRTKRTTISCSCLCLTHQLYRTDSIMTTNFQMNTVIHAKRSQYIALSCFKRWVWRECVKTDKSVPLDVGVLIPDLISTSKIETTNPSRTPAGNQCMDNLGGAAHIALMFRPPNSKEDEGGNLSSIGLLSNSVIFGNLDTTQSRQVDITNRR